MGTSVDSDSTVSGEDGKALGVRFAESKVGKPIVAGLLFIAGSFWLILASIGVVLTLIAMALWNGVMAGIIAIFGTSAIFVGLLGYGALIWFKRRADERE